MNRRQFVTAGSLVGAGLAVGIHNRAVAQESEPKMAAELKISSQEGIIPGANLAEKVAKMAKWGIVGLEVGGGGLAGRVDELKRVLEGTPVKMSAICAGYDKCLIADSEADRRRAVDTMKEILPAAGAIGSTGLIVVPAFNGQSSLPFPEARKILVDLLKEVGEFAQQAGTRVLLEPLNRGEAMFLRLLADAAAICRDVDSPGVGMMGDFYHMNIEETSDQGAFLSAGQYLHHVHLASRKRVLPGQDERSFVGGFKGLQTIGYHDYCSFECGVEGDGDTEIPKSVVFLREQWEKAKA
jgi:sugar phosphate isomerase/epimerase